MTRMRSAGCAEIR